MYLQDSGCLMLIKKRLNKRSSSCAEAACAARLGWRGQDGAAGEAPTPGSLPGGPRWAAPAPSPCTPLPRAHTPCWISGTLITLPKLTVRLL